MSDLKAKLSHIVADQPHPLLFVTVSGAHLYGFASADSDYDLRGTHVLPLDDMIGLAEPAGTIEVSRPPAGPSDIDLDLVTHDVKKFFTLMLRKNGYVLEQLHSPLVVHTTPEHEELRALARGCVTRHHVHHYLGFANTQWKLVEKDERPRAKPLLYVYRVLLTGIHLMRTGEVEANLVRLNEQFRLGWVDELIAAKTAGGEAERPAGIDLAFHREQYKHLCDQLSSAADASELSEAPAARDALDDLLIRIRRKWG